MKSITSLILIIAGILLFMFFTKPKLAELKETQMEIEKLNVARDNAKNLESRINELLQIKNSISPQDMAKLDKMLPNNVENVKLIIDFDKMLQAMVEERGTLPLYKSTEVTETGTKKISIEDPKIVPGGVVEGNLDSTRLGVVSFSFAVTLTYDDFIEFLRRIEYSTRIHDIESITFTTAFDSSTSQPQASSIYKFNVTLRTYWLRYIDTNQVNTTAQI